MITTSSGDTAAVTATPGSLTFTSANWATPQTVALSGAGDDDVRDESVAITVAVDDATPTTTSTRWPTRR